VPRSREEEGVRLSPAAPAAPLWWSEAGARTSASVSWVYSPRAAGVVTAQAAAAATPQGRPFGSASSARWRFSVVQGPAKRRPSHPISCWSPARQTRHQIIIKIIRSSCPSLRMRPRYRASLSHDQLRSRANQQTKAPRCVVPCHASCPRSPCRLGPASSSQLRSCPPSHPSWRRA
jgi:hypothetical protein